MDKAGKDMYDCVGRRNYEPKNAVREYVTVDSVFDRIGFVQPKTIFWADGRVFQIESVQDYFPVQSETGYYRRDCYKVIINGEEKYLFFEYAHELSSGKVGRWFVLLR